MIFRMIFWMTFRMTFKVQVLSRYWPGSGQVSANLVIGISMVFGQVSHLPGWNLDRT